MSPEELQQGRIRGGGLFDEEDVATALDDPRFSVGDLAREDLGDWDRPGKNNRPVGKIEGRPKAQLIE